jgi:hypothetical protein
MFRYTGIAFALAGLVGLCVPTFASATAETSPPVSIKSMRVYTGGGVYVETVETPAACATSIFVIQYNDAARDQMTSVVMTALTTGKKVLIEVANCVGWGSSIQSIYLLRDN